MGDFPSFKLCPGRFCGSSRLESAFVHASSTFFKRDDKTKADFAISRFLSCVSAASCFLPWLDAVMLTIVLLHGIIEWDLDLSLVLRILRHDVLRRVSSW